MLVFVFHGIVQPSEQDLQEEKNRKDKLSTFTFALGAFISGGEDQNPPPNLPAPISNDLLAGAGMKSPTEIPSPKSGLPLPAPGGGAAAAAAAAGAAAAVALGGVGSSSAASRSKPPAGVPPMPGSSLTSPAGMKSPLPGGRPPPPSGPPAMPGTAGAVGSGRAVSLQRQSSAGKQALTRARSASPPPASLGGGFSASTAIDGKQGQVRESRSASSDWADGGKRIGPLPPGAEKIMEMGFSEKKARAALEKAGGDASQAVELLLAQPPSPAGKGDTDEERPPSPSTASPPSRKSLTRKPKAGKPQNPVFDQEAFTPILIPAKPGAIVVSPQPPWTAPGGGGGVGGGAVGMPQAIPVAMAPNTLGVGLGAGPGPVPVQGVGLVRPRSTPDVISALDPDSVDSFERSSPLPPKQDVQQQPPPQQQQAQAALQGSPGQGIPRYRRQSAPTGMLPGGTNSLAVPGVTPPGPRPMQQSQAPTSAPAPLAPAQQQQRQQQQQQPPQQQTLPSSLGLGNARRPPPPSMGAAVGGATTRGPARTPAPLGRASVGGSAGVGSMLPAGVAGMVGGGSAPSQALSQPVVSGQGQASPQFQQGIGMMPPQQQKQQQQQQQLQGMSTMPATGGMSGMATQGGMSAMPAQGLMQPQQQQQQARPVMQSGMGVQQARRPTQAGMAGTGGQGIPSLTPIKAGAQSGMVSIPQQQQQFGAQNRGTTMMGSGPAPRGTATNTSGQQQLGQASMVRR